MNKLSFKAEVKKQLALRQWNYADLEKATGYKQTSIQVMMSDDSKLSETAIKKIAEALSINLQEV